MTDPLASVALVERLPRVVYRVTGERPLGYLHDVLAQDVIDLKEGSGAIAALLTPEGRVAAEVRVLPFEKDVLLDAEVAARDGIERYIVRPAGLGGCEVIDTSEDSAVVAVRGAYVDGPLSDGAVPLPADVEAASVPAGDALVVRVKWGVPGVDVVGPTAMVDDIVRTVLVPRATVEDLEAARIAAGRPAFGPDIDETTLVNETPLLAHGVSMTKGCYPGQESVARVHNLGRVRRMLRGLRSEGSLVAGADVRADGAVAGTVTSAAPVASGGSAAIALLRSEVPPGAIVEVAGEPATVEELA